MLRDVSHIDTSTTLLGGPSALPFAFAPTGFTRMMHHAGEPAVARVAGRIGVPHTLSTMGTTSPEDLAAAAPDTRRWFQLYLWRDRAASEEVVRRAAEAGNEAIMLTVDTPVGGARLRDAYNGLTIPPALTARTLFDMARHPHWWANVLTTDPLEFAALTSWEGTVAELIDSMFDPALTLDDLTWLRSTWNGPLVVKGVQTAEDARRVVDAGADAVIVSNHGGRQLDRAPVPLETLPSVVAEVGGRGRGPARHRDHVGRRHRRRRRARAPRAAWSAAPTSTRSWPAASRASSTSRRSSPPRSAGRWRCSGCRRSRT